MPLISLLSWVACTEYNVREKAEPVDEGHVDSAVEEACDLVASSGPASVDEACVVEVDVGSFNPIVEWQWSSNSTHAGYDQIMSTPAVGLLNDDDSDGDVDLYDIPDVVFSAFTGAAYTSAGALVATNGDGTGDRWSIVSSGGYSPYSSASPAIGDLDNEGHPEVCTAAVEAAVLCVRGRDGAFVMAGGTETYSIGAPAIADIDGDGSAEVIFGRTVLNADGSTRWVGAGGLGNATSFAIDVDQDGQSEVMAGNTLYDTDGTILWTAAVSDGFGAAGDFDLDGVPEFVNTSGGALYVLESADGAVRWSGTVPSGGSGAPTVADFDNDGYPEIGVAGAYVYAVFDTDGTLLWTATIQDTSSRVTGSSVFDFEGDGYADVVYADELTLWVFDGATGAVKFQLDDHASGTLYEYPLIVDVDNDGVTEIVLASNNYTYSGWNGITVIGDGEASWRPSRPVWNQYAYSVTNIDDDSHVPAWPEPSWERLNTFRAGGVTTGAGDELAQLSPVDPELCETECGDGVVWFTVDVANTGTADSGAFTVTFVNDAGETVQTETLSLDSGATAALGPYGMARSAWGGDLRVTVDAAGEIEECDEADNTLDLGAWPCD